MLMRYDAPFLVKRYAPMMGRWKGQRRVTVAYQAYRLQDALTWATEYGKTETRMIGPNEWAQVPVALWIERRGQSARA